MSGFAPYREIVFTHTYADGVERQGCIVVPDKPAPGNHWVYQTEFFGHPEAALDTARQFVADGWYVVTLKGIDDHYGCPAAVECMKEFHDLLVQQYDLFSQCVLFGISRGGLYAFNFAMTYPERVAGIYLDAPVQDICSWPGGSPINPVIRELYAGGCPADARHEERTYQGSGNHAPEESGTGKTCWQGCLDHYGFQSQEDAILRDAVSPVYRYDELLSSGIPVLVQASTADTAVPYAENAEKLIRAFTDGGKAVRVAHEPPAGWLTAGPGADCAAVTAYRTERGGHYHGWHDPADISSYIRAHMTGR